MEALHKDDPTHIGPYRTLVRFRETASSVQYLAHAPDGGTVLVTRARRELSGLPAFQRQFATEARTGGRLAGGWVQTLLNSRTDGDDLWTARGYVPSLTLGEAVALVGPLPERAVRVLGAALAEALARVHATDAVHQGLSAETVLLAADGPRLTAFGALGAAASAQRGPGGQLSVQLGYLTPEQASGARPVPASDVFVLGHLLTYAATGRSPFPGGSLDAAPDLGAVPAALRPLLAPCLAASPQDRPAPTDIAVRLAPDSPAALAAQGWLPGRVLAALSEQASAVLALEAAPVSTDAPPAPTAPPLPAPAPAPVNGAPARPHPATALDAGLTPPRTPTDPGASAAPDAETPPPAKGPGRRTLLTALLAGTAGLAVGGATAFALSSDRQSRNLGPAPVAEPRIPGTSPTPLWHHRHTTAVSAPAQSITPAPTHLCVWRDQVLVLTGENQPATGIDIRTGRVLWTQKSLAVNAPAVVADDKHCFVVDSVKQSFVRFDARDGVVRSRVPMDPVLPRFLGSVSQTLAAEGTVVWLVCEDISKKPKENFVLAYDMASRKEIWRSPLPRSTSNPTFRVLALRPEGLLLRQENFSVDDSVREKRGHLEHLLLLDRKTGKPLWAKEFAGVKEDAGLTAGPSGPLYAATGDAMGHLDALDLTTGRRTWRLTGSGGQAAVTPPFGFGSGKVHGSTLYVGGTQSMVHAVDTATGTQRWARPTEDSSSGVSAVSTSSTGRTVVALGATQLTAFDAREGELRWKFTDAGQSVKGEDRPEVPVYNAKIAGRTLLAFRGDNIYALALD